MNTSLFARCIWTCSSLYRTSSFFAVCQKFLYVWIFFDVLIQNVSLFSGVFYFLGDMHYFPMDLTGKCEQLLAAFDMNPECKRKNAGKMRLCVWKCGNVWGCRHHECRRRCCFLTLTNDQHNLGVSVLLDLRA